MNYRFLSWRSLFTAIAYLVAVIVVPISIAGLNYYNKVKWATPEQRSERRTSTRESAAKARGGVAQHLACGLGGCKRTGSMR